jgi:hypothetical protein
MRELGKDESVKITRPGRLIGILAASLSVAAVLMAGCGGGDGDSLAEKASGGSSKQVEGPDDYASQVCSVFDKYAGDIEELSNSEAGFEDPEAMKDAIAQAVPVLEGLSNDLDKIDPPSEIADWHDGIVSGMKMAADLFNKMGDALDKPIDEAMADITELTTDMAGMEDPFGSMADLPQDYQQAFEDNPDCKAMQNVDLFQ